MCIKGSLLMGEVCRLSGGEEEIFYQIGTSINRSSLTGLKTFVPGYC
jgi:hypothetical protein